MIRYDVVTSWTAQRRHCADPGSELAICGAVAVRAGDYWCDAHEWGLMDQDTIQGLPECSRCDKIAPVRQGKNWKWPR